MNFKYPILLKSTAANMSSIFDLSAVAAAGGNDEFCFEPVAFGRD